MFFYYVVIYPIRQLLEFFFVLFNEATDNVGLAIIGLSFVVTLACLPLYVIAENWQEKERLLQNKLSLGIKRIKSAFKGDEQYMMLTTFYRQNGYHPIMALRSSFGLLIQIPFFIAAYNFLSHLELLSGRSFLFIKDMGKPDATFMIGSFAVNVLPLAMTLINLISGTLYSAGHNKKEKIQIYLTALVFLVLLYKSPAGLVIYWTMNNILSLVKNVFYKFKNPIKVLYIACAIPALIGLFAGIFVLTRLRWELRTGLIIFTLAVIASPFIVKLICSAEKTFLSGLNKDKKTRALIFVFSALILTILTGLTIPSTLIQSEPDNFCYLDGGSSPFGFLRIAFFEGIGLFLFWPICFYALFPAKIKNMLTFIFSFLALYAVINNYIFAGNYGPMTSALRFMQEQSFAISNINTAFNFIILVLLLIGLLIILKKLNSIITPYSIILFLSLTAVSVRNIYSINTVYKSMTPPVTQDTIEPVYHLSKTQKNVIVFMQDRNFGPIMDDIFEENTSLAKQFDGFTFYPNCVSMGRYTMLGVVGLFGGYDYTPYELNKNPEKTLREKHNEALLSMPVLFSENGFDVTVSELPYENFLKYPIDEMYEKYPLINRQNIRGQYSDIWYKENNVQKLPFKSYLIRRNLFMFSIFKIVPPIFRRIVYAKHYWDSAKAMDTFSTFIDNYAILDYLPELFATDADNSTFIEIDNETTHEPLFLQAPEYVPVNKVTNYGNSKYSDDKHYHAQAGTMRCYGEFFDYLRAQGVYDNTRIIIVSDHGTGYSGLEYVKGETPSGMDPNTFIPCLLFKDFNAHTYKNGDILLKKDFTFMTNADTPALASKDIIPNAKNPFTGNSFEVSEKQKYVKMSNATGESTRHRNHTRYFVQDDEWFTVKDDITLGKNWSNFNVNTDPYTKVNE